MADNDNKFNFKAYYNQLTQLFKGSGPVVHRQVANKISPPGTTGVPIGTARAFLKHASSAYANHLRSYGQYNRLARYSDYSEMESMAEIACITGNTRIATLWGFISIKKLTKKFSSGEPFEVWAWDSERNLHTVAQAHHPRKTGEKEVVKVILDNGKSFECTLDHRIMLKDGTYKQAQFLEENDSLMPFNYNTRKNYLRITNPRTGKLKEAHRYIYEEVLEKEIGKNNIHHINYNKRDNRTKNLQEMTPKDHMILHGISRDTNKKRKKTCKELWKNEEYRNKVIAGVKSWTATPEAKEFYSKHATEINEKRWKTDKKYAKKMAKIFSQHAKKLWADPEWAAWKKKHHSETLKLKYANDPSLRERVARKGKENGRYNHDITNDQILISGINFDSFDKFAENFDFRGRKFASLRQKVQFLRRRLNACGYKTWRDYKDNYIYNNHKVVKVIFTGKVEEVYDLTVDHFENFAIESGIYISNSGLDIYSDETCSKGEYGELLRIDSPNPTIKKALNELFYDTLNIEFNSWHWVRNMCKYGDQFLLVDHHPDYGVINALPMPVNEIEREERYDPEDPTAYRYRWVTQGNRPLENWQVIHFRLLGNDAFLPYGSSVVEPARRVWRQLILMEDAVMVYRIVRSPERRVFYIDIGNIAPQDVQGYIEKVKTQLKRNQVIDSDTGRVDLRYNPLSTDEDYFIPTRGEHSSRIDTLAGGQFTGDIEDLQYIQNKLFAALKIPKSYLGYEGDIGSKSTLSQEDVRFGRTIQRIQRVFVAELNKIAIIHLYSMGMDAEDLTNFEISMANPSSISELQRLEVWRNKFEVASVAAEGLLDRHFVYSRLFKLSNQEIESIEEGKRKDRMFDLELESIQPPPVEGEEAPAAPEPAPEEVPTEPAAEPAAEPSPEAGGREGGLPPPPGEEPITAGKDPNRQIAAPNELVKVPKKKKRKSTMPDLANHTFNLKKTAMDPKRNASELSRFARNPFGESAEEDKEVALIDKKLVQLKRFAEELENINVLKTARERKIKKVIID
jgi:hypothetical protein